MAEYSYVLDDAELARYDAMAARAFEHEAELGVDDADHAVAAARALVDQRGLGERVRIVQAGEHRTGLGPASFDVAFARNVLVHNGPARHAILDHARGLLRPEGHLLCVEPDITGLRYPEWAAVEQEMEQRWVQMMRSMGKDPGLGAEGRLADLISTAAFTRFATDADIAPMRRRHHHPSA